MIQVILFLFGLLLLAPVTGELFRIPVAGFDLLPSDILILVLITGWGIHKIRRDRYLRLGRIGKSLLVLLGAMAIGFLINLFRHDLGEMFTAFAYFARYWMYLALAFVAFDLNEADKKGVFSRVVLWASTASLILVCVFGFLQLILFPNFLDLGMDVWGWDPHIGRLVSTWLDPNYVGGFLAFLLCPLAALALLKRQSHDRRAFWLLFSLATLGGVALYLTYSRSAYLAFLAGIFTLAFLKSRKLLAVGLIAILLVFGLSARVRERTADAWDSGKSFLGLDSQVALDPTAQLRVDSWRYAREIIEEHPFIGIGYNRYKFEINKRGHGLLTDHAAGGSDSSLLTVWATTGIFGLLAYFWVWLVAGTVLLKRAWKNDTFRGFLDAGLLAGFVALAVHSVFVNSLFYPPILLYLAVGLGMIDEDSTKH